MSYRAQKIAGLVFLGMYYFAGTIAIDTYPFFNWSLFSEVPNEQQGYTIEIERIGDRDYDLPLPFSKSRFIFEEIGQSPTEYTRRIEDLGRALENHSVDAVRRERGPLEKIFTGKSFSYTIFSVTYDPLKRWKTDEYDSAVPLATFTDSDP